MTVLLKASDMGRKSDSLNIPLVVDVEIQERAKQRPRPRRALSPSCNMFMLCLAFFVVLALIVAAFFSLLFFTDFNSSMGTRYKGYCAIPIDVAQILQSPQVPEALKQEERVPLQWSSQTETDVVVAPPEPDLARLLEHFDIDGSVERVAVYNGGNNVEFIHDFSANATGIVEKSRCFVMPLDPEVVVMPHMFVMSIVRGDAFDVRRVRARLHALLPPLAGAGAGAAALGAGPALTEACRDRPAYALHGADDDSDLPDVTDDDDAVAIRKRSVENPKPEYMHFAGRFVQEISIDNMAELLAYEKKTTA